MKLRDKDLLAIGPLVMILTILAVGLVVFYQAYTLPQQMREKIKEDYLEAKKNDLRGHIKMATKAIMHLYKPGSILTNDEAKEEAKKILTNLRYSEEDGYFFGFQLDGTAVFHPFLRDWIGQNKWDYQDQNGKFVIRDLIKAAREGDGFEEYIFRKPSVVDDEGRSKLAYVVVLPELDFVLGTGTYQDDIDSFLNGIEVAVSNYIRNSMAWIALIAFLGLLILSFAQRRIGEIVALSDITTKLHDNVKQESAFIIREIGNKLENSNELSDVSGDLYLLKKIDASAQRSLKWMRAFIAGEDPNNLALVDRLNEVIECFKEREENIAVNFSPSNELGTQLNNLSETKKSVLTEIATEALNNIGAHVKGVTLVAIQLQVNVCNVILSIQNDGAGFEPGNAQRGTGLNTMEKNIKKIGGTFHVASSPSKEGATITVTVPLSHNIGSYLLCLMKRQ
ncbi:MAG: cache domain-containing protein [Nitrosomonas sp.]|nr:cache domain-containing protein [Nitrosomonas sp.]